MGASKRQRIPKGQSKMDNTEKLATQGIVKSKPKGLNYFSEKYATSVS